MTVRMPKTCREWRNLLLFLTLFAGMTIPRSGTKVGDIPITVPNLLYAFVLFLWLCRPVSEVKLSVGGRSLYEGLSVCGVCLFMLAGFGSVLTGLVRTQDSRTLIVNACALLGFVPMFFILKEAVNTENSLRVIINLIVVSTFLVCIYGIIQRIFGHYQVMIPGITVCYSDAQLADVFESKNNMTAVGLKVVSTFQNGNLYGNFLALVLPLPIALAACTSGWRKKFHILLAILVMINLMLSLSRGAILASMLSLCFLAWYLRPARMPLYFLAGCIVVGGVAISLLQLSDRLLAYDPTAAGRIPMYQAFVDAYSAMPVHSFLPVAVFGAGMGGDIGTPAEYVVATESSLMMILLESGLLGLFAFGMAVLGSVKSAVQTRRSVNTVNGAVAAGIAVGVIGSTIQLAIDQVIMLPPTALNLWMMLGLAVAAGRILRINGGEQVNE